MKKGIAMILSFCLLVALSACTKPTGGRVVDGEQTQNTSTSSTTSIRTTDSSSVVTTSTTTTAATSNSKAIATTPSSKTQITRDRAIELALQAAGLTRDKVRDLEAELDRERNGLFWEVDFETGEYEYSYDIHTETGVVVKAEHEKQDRD